LDITVLVRSPDKAKLLGSKSLGVKTLVGSNDDVDLLENAAKDADVVIACADADHLGATEALLRGLKSRRDSTGILPILIHTSGTGVLAYDSKGAPPTKDIIVYDDSNADVMEQIPEERIHRNVDLAIVEADKKGDVNSYIVLPSTIYGIAQNRLVDLGIQNPRSQQIPLLVRASLDRKQGGMVGEGKNVWPNVHIDDVTDLYVILFDKATSPNAKNLGHGREGYYFGVNGEHSLYQIGQAICQSLIQLDPPRGTNTPTTFSHEEIEKYFGGSEYLGSNSRAIARRSESIGWRPTKKTEDMLNSVEGEVKAELEAEKHK